MRLLNPFVFLLLTSRIICTVLISLIFLLIIFFLYPFSSKKSNYRIIRFWGRCICFSWGIRITILRDGDTLEQTPCVITSNHQSYFDIPFLLSVFRTPFRFAADECIYKFPFFGLALKAARCIRVERDSPASVRKTLNESASVISNDENVLIFHEGGINRTNNPEELWNVETGFWKIASIAEAPILAVTIYGLDSIQNNITRLSYHCRCSIPNEFLHVQQKKQEKRVINDLMKSHHRKQYTSLANRETD